MHKQDATGRYHVFHIMAYTHHPRASEPAAHYNSLQQAISHAQSVTHRMAVVDSAFESRGYVYINWEQGPASSPWGPVQQHEQLAPGIWKCSTASHGGIWISEERLTEANERFPHWGFMAGNISLYPTFCGSAQWFEEDCDWVVPMLVFAKEINNRSKIDAAAKQLEYMAKNNMGHGVEGKYSRAWDTLKPAYDEYCEWASRIASISRCYKDGMCDLLGILRDGSEISLFTYFTDELSFLDCELIGLTVDEALKLRQDRDVAYLQS